MTQKIKQFKNRAVWIIFILILLAAFSIPQLIKNSHCAPYYYNAGNQITLENKSTHKLNDYQKKQFICLARHAIDQRDGPFDWNNYQNVSISVYKMKTPSEYGLIYKIKPQIRSKKDTITNSVIIKLADRDLKGKRQFTIKDYSSGFSNFLNN